MPAPLTILPTVVGFQAAQQLNRRWLRDVTTGGELHIEILGVATLTILDNVIPFVPVFTGTLQAAQSATVFKERSEALIFTEHEQNPIFRSFADQYAPEVLKRIDFYEEGVIQAQYLLESEVYDTVEAFVLPGVGL